MQKLLPLHSPLGKPQPGDWLTIHDENGQTYSRYVAGQPLRATPERRTLVLVPLGNFSEAERAVVRDVSEALSIFFQLPVRVHEDMSLDHLPATARRSVDGTPQVLTEHVLLQLLKPALPADAVAMIGLTTTDLWPGHNWSFVFGEASLDDRVGVWSMHRFGEPGSVQAMRRTMATATHETGHMFSMHHCVHFACNMNGSESLAEADRSPLWLCPDCLAKLVHATGADPRKRFDELAEFAERHGLVTEAAFWKRSSATLG